MALAEVAFLGKKDELDRRADAVRGAFEALRTFGLGDLSFDLVAKEAGMSRQLVRYHFPDHEALMVAVCDHLAQLYQEPLIATAGSLDGPKRIEAFLDFYFDLLEGTPKPRDDQAYDALMAMATRSEPVRSALSNQYGLLGQVLTHEFVVQYPDLDLQSASELSYLFVSMMYGHWKMVASLGYSEAHNKVTRQAVDRLIASYRASPAQERLKFKIWSK